MTVWDKQLIENIPDVYDYKTLLYIGARPEGIAFIENFKERDYKIELVEVFKKNCELIGKHFDVVYNADIRDFDVPKSYDIIVWFQGPEHINKNELPAVTEKLWMRTNKILIYGVPWGIFPQEPFGGNENERHLSEYYPRDFPDMEYHTRGTKDMKGSDMLLWRRK